MQEQSGIALVQGRLPTAMRYRHGFAHVHEQSHAIVAVGDQASRALIARRRAGKRYGAQAGQFAHDRLGLEGIIGQRLDVDADHVTAERLAPERHALSLRHQVGGKSNWRKILRLGHQDRSSAAWLADTTDSSISTRCTGSHIPAGAGYLSASALLSRMRGAIGKSYRRPNYLHFAHLTKLPCAHDQDGLADCTYKGSEPDTGTSSSQKLE